MLEREVERIKEPEPPVEKNDMMIEYATRLLEARRTGKVLVKYNELFWSQSRQGLLRRYTTPENVNELAGPGWYVFQNRILKHSGKHIHQGGIPIFVLQGEGYSVVDGVRYDWKPGDMIVLTIKPDGCEHQHFNTDKNIIPQWIAVKYMPFGYNISEQVRQVVPHPDWAAAQQKEGKKK
ncbi:cupin domain-containing protein [Chloroflexota bacterium]